MTTKTRKITTGVLAGIAGGLLAAWVMDKFQSIAAKAQASRESEQEEGDNAKVKAASAMSETFAHHQLTPDEKKKAGPLFHYLMGGLSGAVYGGMAALEPTTTIGLGTLFGATVWLLADEIALPALGLSKSPTEYPLAKHALALVSHLVYGLTTDATRRAITAAV